MGVKQGIFTGDPSDDPVEYTGSEPGNVAAPATVQQAAAPVPQTVGTVGAAPVPVDLSEATMALHRAQEAYEQAGRDVQNIAAKLKHAELDLQNAARALRAIEPRVSASDLARDFSASEMAKRAQIKEQGFVPVPSDSRPGPSALDRSKFRGSGSDGRDLAMRMQRHGASRGAFPASMRGAFVPPKQ
ncbi:MAG TPA: hypothetical protein VNZ53_04185 [Steroidobacteraceae bacterium]|jgi:hypothetical protein|nr:hypothetical protein [Steroidobacteraceae bacterium]